MSYQGSHIGTLIKPHGYKGELLLKGKPEILRELKLGIPLFIELSGQLVPFFVEEFSHDLSGEKCIVRFGFIESDVEARRYTGCEVFNSAVSQVDRRSEILDVKEYKGFTVIDTKKDIKYTVADYYDNPGNPVLLLERKGNEVMLPVNADFILSVDISRKTIKAAFPSGLV
ncbi:MAG: hypothetical protein WD577_00625 [Bacteroidales bacterium]